MSRFFSRTLVAWYRRNRRQLPWRQTTDPYRIWLSEVILQQTQVAQGLSYYLAFTEKYPTVQDLAAAPEDEVLKLWQGLGYYSRARNLHAAAKYISEHMSGRFPGSFDGLKALKGVGDYTAAAIASIAFGLPHGVVDGNVYRVLSRCFGVDTPIDSASGKKQFLEIADGELDRRDPGTHNQAVMEFGALVCRPQNPACHSCPLNTFCAAFLNNRVNELPVKNKKTKSRHRHLNYLVVAGGDGRVRIEKRTGSDIWKGLYQFPVIETSAGVEPEEFLKRKDVRLACGDRFTVMHVSEPVQHVLTHQKLHARFYVLRSRWPSAGESVRPAELEKFAFPRLISRFMENCDLEEMF